MAGAKPNTYGLTAKQYGNLSEVITSLGIAGAGNAIDEFQNIVQGLDDEKRKQALQVLSQMDITSTDSILSTFT